MKKVFAFMLVLVMLFSFNVIISFAGETDKTTLFKVGTDTRELTKPQIEKLSQEDINKVSIRTQKDVESLLDKCETNMQKDIDNKLRKNINLSRASGNVKLGADKTFSSCDTGNKGNDSSLISGTKESYASSNSKSSCWTAAAGSGSSWAYTAKTITVSGSGSQYAYVRFYGSYLGTTNPGFMGGSAGARIRVSVYDVTTGSEIGGQTPLDENDSVKSISSYSGKITSSVGVQLQAGHTYLLRYGISTSVSNYSPQYCGVNFYDKSNGIKVDNVTIDFT